MNTVYVSDLDGTLLTNEATLSEFSKRTLQKLLRDGLLFTVASARSVVSMGMLLEGLKLPLPVVEFNGAFLSDMETGRHEVINSIEPAVVEDVYRLLPRFGCVPFISTFNGTEDCVYYRDIINDGMRWYLNDRLARKDKRWRSTEDLTRSFRDRVVCLTIVGGADVLSELEVAVQERHGGMVETHHFENPYSPGWYWLTVHDRRASKDQAVRVLMETYGLSGSELVVFGDQNNDIKMFRIADHAVAVANATAELKRHATHLIGSNQEDSVVKYLRDHWAKSMKDHREINIRIHCRNLPGTQFEDRTGVRLGIQRGREVIGDVPADAEGVTFTVPLRVSGTPGGERPNFLGPFAQGTPEERFVYLCWGERRDGAWDGFRRAKIQLRHIGWEAVERASAAGQATIEAVVDMTDATGGPFAARSAQTR